MGAENTDNKENKIFSANDFLKHPVPKTKTPGSVSKNFVRASVEDAENMEAATIIADITGRHLVLLKPKNQPNIKTADILDKDSGELWEIKTNMTATKSAIDNALRKAKKQSEGVILNIKSKISDDVLFDAIKDRLQRTSIKKIIIIKDGNVFEYSRESLLK